MRIAVFAKAPVAGRTKSRLVPAVGEEGAARLHRAFLEDLLARTSALGAVTLWAAGEPGPLRQLAADHGARLLRQVEGDLGARMRAAMQTELEGDEPVVLLGSDSPTLPRWLLRRASLEELAFGPSHDGGYWCVAGRRAPRFDRVRWSTEHALADTLRQNPGATLLPPWYDVDTPADLTLLRAHLEERPRAAPRTAALLQSM